MHQRCIHLVRIFIDEFRLRAACGLQQLLVLRRNGRGYENLQHKYSSVSKSLYSMRGRGRPGIPPVTTCKCAQNGIGRAAPLPNLKHRPHQNAHHII